MGLENSRVRGRLMFIRQRNWPKEKVLLDRIEGVRDGADGRRVIDLDRHGGAEDLVRQLADIIGLDPAAFQQDWLHQFARSRRTKNIDGFEHIVFFVQQIAAEELPAFHFLDALHLCDLLLDLAQTIGLIKIQRNFRF